MHIKEYCKKVGITITDFAYECGIPVSTISSIANKKRFASTEIANKIERASNGFVMSNVVTKPINSCKRCKICNSRISEDTYRRINIHARV